MTATRRLSKGEQEIAALHALVEQYKDDFALPQQEADLLASSYEETRRRFDENGAVREYTQQCHAYYNAKQQDGFFNDDKTGRKIFTEVAAQYLKISEAVKT